jgi:endo-1,4-beta-mannosidase
MVDERFSLGVNYWPRRKAMYWWKDFDAGEVRDEFAQVRALGCDVARIFLLWEDFQPDPSSVDARALADLDIVADAARDAGIGLDVTFFTGHMSGPNWVPPWLLGGDSYPAPGVRQVVSAGVPVSPGHYRNQFTDPVAVAAARRLIEAVVSRLHAHPAVWCWNLGNEPDLFSWPPDHLTGGAWVRQMVDTVKSIDDRPVTCGLHVDSLLRDNGLRVADVFAETDFAVMHAYPMYANWARGPLDPDHVPFTCALTAALSGKRVLMEEFGGCTALPGQASHTWAWNAYGHDRTQFMASEDDLAGYLAAVLPNLVDVGATGAFLWCWADYTEELWDRPPCDPSGAKHERHFGLVRPDGTPKPHAEVLRAFAATKPTIRANPRHVVPLASVPPSSEYYADPKGHCVRLYGEYLALKAETA